MDIYIHGVIAILRGPAETKTNSAGRPYTMREMVIVNDDGERYRICLFGGSGLAPRDSDDPQQEGISLSVQAESAKARRYERVYAEPVSEAVR